MVKWFLFAVAGMVYLAFCLSLGDSCAGPDRDGFAIGMFLAFGTPLALLLGLGIIGLLLGVEEESESAEARESWEPAESDDIEVVELVWQEDRDGVLLELTPGSDIKEPGSFILRAYECFSNVELEGISPYVGEFGFFEMKVQCRSDGRPTTLYVPRGAVVAKPHTIMNLTLTVLSPDGRVLGEKRFEHQLPLGPFSRLQLLRPVVNLLLRIGWVDGQIDRHELSIIEDALSRKFGVGPYDLQELEKWSREPISTPMIDDIIGVRDRFPMMNDESLLAMLTAVVRSNRRTSNAQVALLEEFVDQTSIAREKWTRFARSNKLIRSENEVFAAFELFGLEPDADRLDVVAAYRAKMREYHPDRAASMAPEFQELAHQKCQEFNRAWDVLSRHLS